MTDKLIIISGGQTGVDLAGLWAAKLLGFQTGGKAPAGWRTQLGAQPELGSFFGLTEGSSSYYGRTVQNVIDSDVTLIIAKKLRSSGTALTIKKIAQYEKPSYTIDANDYNLQATVDPLHPLAEYIADDAAKWLFQTASKLNRPAILNVAGNAEQTSPGVFSWSFLALLDILERFLRLQGPVEEVGERIRLASELRDFDTVDKLNNKFSIESI